MSRNWKYSIEQKIQICKDYLSGTHSAHELTMIYPGLHEATVRKWARRYDVHGDNAFLHSSKNNSYSEYFKLMVVEEYIRGKDSFDSLSIKYNIPDKTIRGWLFQYNSNKKLKDYKPIPEVYMTQPKRKTTIEERIEIVEYCISHESNYKETAQKYNVSYSQVYSWVQKYHSNGNEGLKDKRGHKKTDDEVDELEKLRRENIRLKRQLEEERMTVELLKKVQEFERRRCAPKDSLNQNISLFPTSKKR